MKNVSELCVLSSKGDKWRVAQCIGTALFCCHYSLYDLTPLICLKIRARKVKNYRVSILIEYCSRAKLDFICPSTLKTAKSVLNALWKSKHNLLKSLTSVGCARYFSLTTAMDADKEVLFRAACHGMNEVKLASKNFFFYDARDEGCLKVWKFFRINFTQNRKKITSCDWKLTDFFIRNVN